MKKQLVGGLSAVLVLGSFFSAPSALAASPTSGTQKVTISFTWWGDPIRNLVYDGVITAFEKKYPNIVVQGVPLSWSDYWTKLNTELAGGNAPDVMGMHQFFVSSYISQGVLYDLSQFASSGVINLKSFPASVKSSGVVGGKLYMVAQGATMSGQIYNESLFKQAKLPAPGMNWSWDTFIKDATALKKSFVAQGEGATHWGADDESADMEPVFSYYLREHGKNLFTSSGKLGFGLGDLKSWFGIWANLRKQGVIPDAATAAQYTGASVEQSLFANAKVGITAIPANQLYLYQENTKNTVVGLVGEPTFKGNTGEFVEGAYLAVPKSSQHPKEAAEFINFFVNSITAGRIFKIEQGAPGSTKIDNVVKSLLTPTQRREMDFIAQRLKSAQTAPYPPNGYSQISTDFTNAAQAIAFGKESIDQASQQFMSQAKSVLGN